MPIVDQALLRMLGLRQWPKQNHPCGAYILARWRKVKNKHHNK